MEEIDKQIQSEIPGCCIVHLKDHVRVETPTLWFTTPMETYLSNTAKLIASIKKSNKDWESRADHLLDLVKVKEVI